MRTSKGFTLIELLVVISIIGLLASIVLTSLTSARAKARDTRRLTDMHSIQTALEAYASTNQSFPNTSSVWVNSTSGATWISGLSPTYFATVPLDPANTNVNEQMYYYNSNGSDYCMQFPQETDCSKSPYYVGVWSGSCKLRVGTGSWCATH